MSRIYWRRNNLVTLGLFFGLIYMFDRILKMIPPVKIYSVRDNSTVNNRTSLAFDISPNRNRATRLVRDVNCAAIINGNIEEIEKAKWLMDSGQYTRKGLTDKEYTLMTRNCSYFKSVRGYGHYSASVNEKNFPIAFSILLYKQVEQAERLLRAIYAPQNYYCLHVDAYAEKDVHDAVEGIATCFDNVFLASRKEYMVYAGFSRLQADLNCMNNSLQRGDDWKYFINLPSQEFPLKTNKEIVRILENLNGSNDIKTLTGNRRMTQRFSHRFLYTYFNNNTKPTLIKTAQRKENPPYNITVAKGSAYGIFSRNFIYFIINDNIARELLDWTRDIYSADEYYWASLQYNNLTGTPGSHYTGRPDDLPHLALYVAWIFQKPCFGKFVHRVCVFGIEDLQYLVNKEHLFANKFFLDYQPFALDCLEEWHFNKSAEGSQTLNVKVL